MNLKPSAKILGPSLVLGLAGTSLKLLITSVANLVIFVPTVLTRQPLTLRTLGKMFHLATDGKFSMTKDGRQWHWCNKCRGGEGRWSHTHGTETHKGNPKTVTFTAAANIAGVDNESPAEDGVLMYNPAGFVASCLL
jgi:hypothetical protein